MSIHRCKFHGGTCEKHDRYLVLFKVYGSDAIALWPTKYQEIESISNVQTCHHVHNHDEFYNTAKLGACRLNTPDSPHSDICGSISSLLTINNEQTTASLENVSKSSIKEAPSVFSDYTDEDYATDTENESENINSGPLTDDESTPHITILPADLSRENYPRLTHLNTGATTIARENAPEVHYFFRHAGHSEDHQTEVDLTLQHKEAVSYHRKDYDEIQSICLQQPARQVEKCQFTSQEETGLAFNPNNLAIFMTKPVESTEKASFAVDLYVSKFEGQDELKKIGTAYLYLDPRFSTQGMQRTPIIGTEKHVPIGQIQIDYLVITNPVGYGIKTVCPKWLTLSTMHVGHRGSGSGRRTDLPEELLENTIASFNYAHRRGADMCELDVLVSADGVPVVYHDFDVDAATAQQSSDSLGKFRIQVNEFTVNQLREFELLSLHDSDGPYTLNVPNQTECNRPFPTLSEVLDKVDQSCGLNIEIKWPQTLESGEPEAKKCREINDFVDRIINVVEKHARNRRVVLESFDADLVIMLRLKQTRFPVFFLSQGMTDRYLRYLDPRTRSIRNGIYFSQAFNLTGIDLIDDYYYLSGRKLVDFIDGHGLVARAWIPGMVSISKVESLKALGLQSITYDRIDLLLTSQDKLIK